MQCLTLEIGRSSVRVVLGNIVRTCGIAVPVRGASRTSLEVTSVLRREGMAKVTSVTFFLWEKHAGEGANREDDRARRKPTCRYSLVACGRMLLQRQVCGQNTGWKHDNAKDAACAKLHANAEIR